MNTLQDKIKNLLTAAKGSFISYGKDEDSGIFVDLHSDNVCLFPDNVACSPWEVERRSSSEKVFSELDHKRITVGETDFYLECSENEQYWAVLYDVATEQLVLYNEQLIPIDVINRIIHYFTTIFKAMHKISADYHEHGLEHVQREYGYLNPNHYRLDSEVHLSQDGGFSIYYKSADVWEFDAELTDKTVHLFKRVLNWQ